MGSITTPSVPSVPSHSSKPTPPPTTLTTALTDALTTYTLTHPTSHAISLTASAHLPGGNTRTVLHTPPFPLSFSSASGALLYPVDLDGCTNATTTTTTPASPAPPTTPAAKPLIDFLSEYTAAIYGHSHPTIKRALQSALARGWNYGGSSGLEGELARLICERFREIEMVRFVNSGTEANMLALATAVAWTTASGGAAQDGRGEGEGEGEGPNGKGEGQGQGRQGKPQPNVLVFNKGYHGSTISGRLDTRKGSGKISLNLPYNFLVAPYNDLPAAQRVVRDNVPPGETLAAILVEPMLGSGGCFIAQPEFLRGLRRLADEMGALLVVDEVMTSRLGGHGYSSSTDRATDDSSTIENGEEKKAAVGGGGLAARIAPDVRPDLITLGKWVGGGMSFGAFGGRREIMQWFDPRGGRLEHPGTFNNNVFTMAAGCAGLGEVLTGRVLVELNERGERLRRGLDGVLRGCGFVAGVVDENAGDREGDVEGLPVRPITDDEHEDPQVYKKWPLMFVKGVGSLLCVHFVGPERAQLHQLFWLWMVERGFWIAARGFIALNIELTDDDVQRFIEAVAGFVKQYQDLLKW